MIWGTGDLALWGRGFPLKGSIRDLSGFGLRDVGI